MNKSLSPSGIAHPSFDEGVLWQMLPLGICVIDRELRVHGWNRQLETWTNRSFAAAQGKSLCELFPEFDARKYSDRILQVFDTGVPTVLSSALHRYFLPIVASGATTTQWMVQETRILRLAGDNSRVVISMADMTTIARQQEKLRRDRLELLQTQQALEAANDSLQMSLQRQAQINLQLQAEVQERKQIEFELRRQTNELIASKARETEHRRRLEEFVRELTVARQQAEAAVRTKSEFLANMSHEIRTPMTAILGYVELLEEKGLSPDQRQQAGIAIRRNGDHLLDIINDILDISKIEAGKLNIELVTTSIHEVVQDVLEMMCPRANERGLALSADFVEPLPTAVQTDPLRLRQILINLVGNAIKFTSLGQVRIQVRWMDPGTDQGRLQVSVADTGIGMSPRTCAKLFQPFVQADTQLTRNFGGTGLGLAISQRLALMLGGQIDVSSELGLGSTFTLALPCQRVSLPSQAGGIARSSGSSEVESAVPAGSLSGYRILVVDDALDNRKLLSFHLKKAGADIELAENGQEAYERILSENTRPFDVVLMDMQMPILDGYEATRRLRQQGDQTIIIAVTAHAMAEDRDRCLQAGCNDYLTKPIQRESLLRTAMKWCHRSAALSLD